MPVRPLLCWLFRGWGGRQGLVHDVLAQEDDVGLSRAEVADLWQATPGFEAKILNGFIFFSKIEETGNAQYQHRQA